MSGLPSPFPTPALGPFEVSLDQLLTETLATFQESRQYRRQPPLEPDGKFLIGQEHLGNWSAAPSIFIVPTSARYSQTRRTPNEVSPLIYFSQWIALECHCWGDDDPSGQSSVYSFSSSLELFRQLLVGLVENNFGPDHVRVTQAGFVQSTDTNRQGRMFVATIEVETFLVKDPPIVAPMATDTTPGVQASVQVALQNPDGSGTEIETTFVVPP